MCDTLIAAPDTTKYDFGLFAKNSDRPPNEAQYLDWLPAGTFTADDSLKCTYIDIPQTQQTYPVLLSRPFWMWGGEMGVNQHGLAIGNEAVYTKVPANKTPALLGMDLLRLGIERARSAPEAIDVITALLEKFGQGGFHVEGSLSYYHNSFLIADPRESWVLETIDQHWAARQVSPIYSISNLLSIESHWERSSDGLEEYIINKGLARSKERISLSANFSDLIKTTFGEGKKRSTRARELMAAGNGQITIQSMAAILRNHGLKSDPRRGLSGPDICMHASLGPIRISQTTGSLIALLDPQNPLVFATGTSAPCTGIYKPFWVDAVPDLGRPPTDRFDPGTMFWSHERLHREVLQNYPVRLASFQEEKDSLEEEFIQGALSLCGADRSQRKAYSEDCLRRAAEALDRWLEKVQKIPPKKIWTHEMAWKGFNKNAQMDTG